MQIWPKKKTDAEYIEQTRKSLRIAPWLTYFNAVLGLLCLIVFATIADKLIRGLLNVVPAGQQNFMLEVLAGSAGIGLMLGLLFSVAVRHIMDPIINLRSNRLLIQYWDKLVSLGENPADDDSASEAGAPREE